MRELADRLRRQGARLAEGRLAFDRVCSPSDTVARLRPRLFEFGITRLAALTDLDIIGVPVWASIRPNARSLSVCQGKGATDAAAQASAVMEAVEVATAERDDLSNLRLSRRALAAQGRRADLLPGHVRRGHAPPGDDEAIEWLEGYDLAAEAPVWVPYEAVRLDGTGEEPRYWQSSDGLASGNLLLEAVVHGLCERIERDAMTLWMLRPDAEVSRRCIDPARYGDATLAALAASIEAAGLHLRLFDMTSDIGVPASFATVSPVPDGHEADWTHFDVASGYGCHPRPARAAMRAVTEAVQSRLTVISGARDDFAPERYRRKLASEIVTYLRATPGSDCRLPPEPPFGADAFLPTLVERLKRAGVASIVVVPLLEDGDCAVCKMIVPDLEHPAGDRRQRFGRRGLLAMMRAT
jgi:ribosomal protein S12 methylthiotransferase accessory factor